MLPNITLPDSDLTLSAIGLGCAAMGNDPRGHGHADDNESIAAIDAAIETGVNWIDTSPTFGNGHADEVLARALQGRRDAVNIVTHVGSLGARGGLAGGQITRELERTLRRLRVEHVDLLLCDGPDPATPPEDTLAELVRLREHGRIRAWGGVYFGCEAIRAWRAMGPLHVVMPRLNLIERAALSDLSACAVTHGVALVARAPLCRGLLSGAYSPMSRFSDSRSRDLQFQPPLMGPNFALVEQLRAIAGRCGRSPVQLAIDWVLSQAGVVAALVGARRPSQVRELTKLALRHDDAVMAEIATAIADHDAALARFA